MDTQKSHPEAEGSTASRGSRRGPGNREPSAGRAPEEREGCCDEIREKAVEAGGEVKAHAKEAVDQAKGHLTEAVNQRKSRLADQIAGVAAALREGTKKLKESDAEAVAPWAESAAKQIDTIGNYVRDTRIGDAAEDVQSFARRRPEAFIGGAVLLGFALARLLKSSNPACDGEEGQGNAYLEDPYGDTQPAVEGDAGAGPLASDIAGGGGLPADNPAI
jgi:hypothetical protein